MKVTTDSCLFGAWVADDIKGLNADKNILDIGSGSGLLSLMLAQQSAATIDGIELQPNDYLQGLENIADAGREKQIYISQDDARYYAYSKKYDVIISNPPFYESDLKGNNTGKNIAHHDSGLKLEELALILKSQLADSGVFYLLLPARRTDEAKKILATHHLHISNLVFVHQTEKHEPFRVMIKGSLKNENAYSSSLVIKNDDSYTSTFITLLKDYYLNL